MADKLHADGVDLARSDPVEAIMAAFYRYLCDHPKKYARDTIRHRVSIVERYLSAVDPWTATVVDVEAWAGRLGLSTSATRDAVSHVRAFYRWANRTGQTTADPTVAVDLPTARRRVPRPARDVAIGVALAAATPDVAAMIALMAGAGLRCVEVARLRWADVDLAAHRVIVTGKGGHERALIVSTDVVARLAAIDAPGVHVFTGPAGRPYTPNRVSAIVNGHLRACAAGCTAHQLRHRFATTALAACHDLSTVRDLLGHASVTTTEGYAMAAGDDQAAARVRLPRV